MKIGYVYILTNKYNNVFYVGITSDIKKRIYEHKNHMFKGFTQKFNVNKVLYVESTKCITDAINREKQLKKWTREKKLELIKKINPELKDLYDDILRS